ncbi:hypothetical protein MTBBW1_1980010 [Desulfamplus magnetovallimortis]|uniref:DNA primase/polymerase bifunctional N-terminal domain-containing protein n=1 Tax=Desulfamplus magnetovallimortis TaxID=1246637 RepID=A0A1W1HBN0_9BACT|nr:bifunctional DNA primase/polymerase [Desulfamplus magnetovallimortis]SLM29788.1 hypothetical protein MTBBW1_1980010 [Desulfamplus magnetovallimortis]
MNERLEQYRELSKNCSLLPLGYNNLKPAIENWNERCYKKADFCDRDYFDKELGVRNAGIACGCTSKIIAVKIIKLEMFKKWCEFNNIKEPFPKTITLECEEDIKYIIYSYPEVKASYKTRMNVPGIIICAAGSFIPAPGSITKSGQPYIINDSHPISPLPEWMFDVLHNTPPYITATCILPEVIEKQRDKPFFDLSLLRQELDDLLEDTNNKFVQSSPVLSFDLSDTIGRFISDRFAVGKDLLIKTSLFNILYKDWCYMNEEIPLGKWNITKDMESRGFEKKKTKGTRYWVGLKPK